MNERQRRQAVTDRQVGELFLNVTSLRTERFANDQGESLGLGRRINGDERRGMLEGVMFQSEVLLRDSLPRGLKKAVRRWVQEFAPEAQQEGIQFPSSVYPRRLRRPFSR